MVRRIPPAWQQGSGAESFRPKGQSGITPLLEDSREEEVLHCKEKDSVNIYDLCYVTVVEDRDCSTHIRNHRNAG